MKTHSKAGCRLFAALLSIMLVIAMMPAAVQPAWANNAGDVKVAQIGDTQYATLAAAITAADGTESSPTTITLLSGVSANNPTSRIVIPTGKSIVLDLNDHCIYQSVNDGFEKAIITCEGNLTLVDNAEPKTTRYYILNSDKRATGSATEQPEGTEGTDYITATGGCIYGSWDYDGNGGGVQVVSGGAFTMKGGNICGNIETDSRGGGVSVEAGGKFTMEAGYIAGNYGACGGGGVENSGIFKMTGGTIAYNNGSDAEGGGVHNNDRSEWRGSFTMTGGLIAHNSASEGGGVYNEGDFIFSEGSISQNSTTSNGAGLFNSITGDFTMRGSAKISGNTGYEAVYAHGDTKMEGGEISGNNCAAVYIWEGSFTMTDGTITGNMAGPVSGGIHVSSPASLNLGGNITISGNKSNGEDADIYMRNDNQINIISELTGSTNITVYFVDSGDYPTTGAFAIGSNNYTLTAADANHFIHKYSPDYVVRYNEGNHQGEFVEPVTATALALPGELSLKAGQSCQLTPVCTPAGAGLSLTWNTDNASVATVNQSGKIIAVGAGEAVISLYDDRSSLPASCRVTVTAASSGGSHSGGGNSGGTTTSTESDKQETTSTTTNPDGSIITKNAETTSKTAADGTKTTTTKNTVTTTDAAGNKTTAITNENIVEKVDGTKAVTVTDENGTTLEASASLSEKAVAEAAEKNEAVTLPVEVKPASDTKSAPEIEIALPSNAKETKSGVKVEIPIENLTAGTVAVIVKKDGTEEIVKSSTLTE
ncbi:MAG: Ig-like domain-containing protein, partial [Clostridia bacterium]|nr:Ig-like domain-containing protein [Clostridia bacterium]